MAFNSLSAKGTRCLSATLGSTGGMGLLDSIFCSDWLEECEVDWCGIEPNSLS